MRYQPARPVVQRGLRPKRIADKRVAQVNRNDIHPLAGPISSGTALSRVLHTSMLSMTSTAGTDEEYLDRTNDLVADDRTTFDSCGRFIRHRSWKVRHTLRSLLSNSKQRTCRRAGRREMIPTAI